MSLIDGAVPLQLPLGLASVHSIPMDTSLEEPGTTVAGVDAVVLSRTAVTANFAGNVQESIPLGRKYKGSYSRCYEKIFDFKLKWQKFKSYNYNSVSLREDHSMLISRWWKDSIWTPLIYCLGHFHAP